MVLIDADCGWERGMDGKVGGGNGGEFESHVELCGECVAFDEREMGLVWMMVYFVRWGGWRNVSGELAPC